MNPVQVCIDVCRSQGYAPPTWRLQPFVHPDRVVYKCFGTVASAYSPHSVCEAESDLHHAKRHAKRQAAERLLRLLTASPAPPSPAPTATTNAADVFRSRPYVNEPWRFVAVLAVNDTEWQEVCRNHAPLSAAHTYMVFSTKPLALHAHLHAGVRVLWHRVACAADAVAACLLVVGDMLAHVRSADPLLAHVTPQRTQPLLLAARNHGQLALSVQTTLDGAKVVV